MLARLLRVTLLVAVFAGASASWAGEATAPSTEQYSYSWRLRGALSWIARLAFPTSGVGELRNVRTSSSAMESQLLITSTGSKEGYYVYKSEIDPSLQRTLMSYHGYSWGGKTRKERTIFDYNRKIALIREEEPDEVENREKPLSGPNMRDVLTGIHYLRENADRINAPFRADIYSDGKMYPVVFKPTERATYKFNGRQIPARTFLVTAAPGSTKKWPGGLKLWLSDDARNMPLRIEIQRGLASLQLDLKSIG